MYCHLLFMTGSWKSFKRSYTKLQMAKWSRCPSGKKRVTGSISGGYIYFHFEFFACFPSLPVGEALANEIKHDHSPVVSVVFTPDTINRTRSVYTYNRSLSLISHFVGIDCEESIIWKMEEILFGVITEFPITTDVSLTARQKHYRRFITLVNLG